MLTREEVIEIADECVFDIVEPDEYHDKREIADSGNLWITERMERFAQACYRRGVEDAAKFLDETESEYFDGHEFQKYTPPALADEIRKLLD